MTIDFRVEWPRLIVAGVLLGLYVVFTGIAR